LARRLWRRWPSTTTVQETPVGTLTVDMFDAKSKKLIWRSTSTETLSNKPEKNTKKLDDGCRYVQEISAER